MVSHYRVDHAAYNQSRWESVSLQKGEGRPGASGAFMTTITPSVSRENLRVAPEAVRRRQLNSASFG